MTKEPSDISFGDLRIGSDQPPVLVVEIGSNHDGSLSKALELFQAAADAGAHAVKIQLFHPEDLYPPGTEPHATLESLAVPRSWLPELADVAADLSLEFLGSAFCDRCVSDLDEVGVTAHKVASSELTNLSLLTSMATSGKPMLLSTGMANLSDVARAVEVCGNAGNASMVIMQCTSLYPTPPEHAHLLTMAHMAETFGHHVGFSDHTLGTSGPLAAVALGATVVEKHLTLDRRSPGPDHPYAAEPDELDAIVRGMAEAYAMRGLPEKRFLPAERAATRRVGLYLRETVPAGTELTSDLLVERRPALGVEREFKDAVLGARVLREVAEDAPLRWEDIALTEGGPE